MKRFIRLDEYANINPPVSLTKGKLYPCVMMEDIEPGSRYVHGTERREYTGGGAKFHTGDTLFARITPCLGFVA